MLRFVLLVLLGAGAWYGWQIYAEREAAGRPGFVPSDRGGREARAGLVEATAAPASLEGDPQLESGAEGTVLRASAATGAETWLATTLSGLGASEPAAAIAAHRFLCGEGGDDARPGDRARLGSGLHDWVHRETTVAALLSVLGEGNAFLHSDEGRSVTRKVLEKARKLPDEQAFAASNQLLARSVAGVIRKEDDLAFHLVNEIYSAHRILVDRIVFDPTHVQKAREYKVQSGDTLDQIAAVYRKQGLKIEGWTLCILNRIDRPSRLQAGKTIKIPTEPISARLEKESFTLGVYVGDALVRLYWVGHGKDGKTPVTDFTVGAKLSRPDWYTPSGEVYPYGHPKNVLGDYFIKFEHPSYTGFGAHGTTEPDTLRTETSLGCIRMGDQDIEELFRFLPGGVTVEVRQSR